MRYKRQTIRQSEIALVVKIKGEDASGSHGFALSLVLLSRSVLACDTYDPNNCNGVDWDDKRALIVAKVTAHPRVNFIKSPYDNGFKAEGCPAAGFLGFHRLA
jgi:hypothetical protein